jgi:peptide chain release factor 1
MERKIKELKKEYEKINKELQRRHVGMSPAEGGFDNEKIKKLYQKQNELSKIINEYEEMEKIKNQIKGDKEIIKKEKDQDLIKLAEEELKRLNEEKKLLEKKIADLLKPQNPMDKKNAIIEIRAGAGGGEAALFVADLLRMYSRFAEKENYKMVILNISRSDSGGIKEVAAEMNGQNVYGKIKQESGVHRVQRIPTTEKSGRIHTSTASVAVLPQAEEVDVKINPADVKIDVFRSSGPGGQSVNTTDSAIRITHLSTGIVVSCQDEKSQLKNKEKALRVLRSKLLSQKQEEESQKRGEMRRDQIGSAMRSEKIRTYNFPQDRVTDHRVGKSWHNLDKIMDGEIKEIIKALNEN